MKKKAEIVLKNKDKIIKFETNIICLEKTYLYHDDEYQVKVTIGNDNIILNRKNNDGVRYRSRKNLIF